VNVLRMFLIQTKMNFVWYFRRDGELIFWTLAMPVFFLVLFSFAFSTGPNSGSSGFLVPGIIGAQVLSSGFWGVGVMLATFREKHLLRRVYLTPMPPWIFFASLVAYRMTLLAAQAVILIAVGGLLFHVHVIGRPWEILAVLLLGTATFVSLGTIVGALARTTESANNIASVLTVPLAFLSDAYIPIDRFPHAVSSAAAAAAVDAIHRHLPRRLDLRCAAGALRSVDGNAGALDHRRHRRERPDLSLAVAKPRAMSTQAHRRLASDPRARHDGRRFRAARRLRPLAILPARAGSRGARSVRARGAAAVRRQQRPVRHLDGDRRMVARQDDALRAAHPHR